MQNIYIIINSLHIMPLTHKLLLLFLLISMISTSMIPVVPSEDTSFKKTDITTLPYKQQITIPIDTSLLEARYQPIDIRIEFQQTCWAENETKHSVRVAYDDGSDLNEIESQIYDLSHTDQSYIDACSLIFLIPESANGEETYYVLYSDSETEPSSYPKHLTLSDTHYYYEPISGQKMDFDYYQINEDGYIIYAICQRGELLGNGMSNAIIKLKPNSKEFKTTNAEQIAAFYTTYSINPPGEHTGTQLATDITKTILVDGNLMIRLQIQGTSPGNEFKTDNIYSYYYCPNVTKTLHVNVNHEVLKDLDIKGDKQKEGVYASLSTIKARSATIKDMNLGDILPAVNFHRDDETIIEYEMPTDPDASPAEWILSDVDDQDLGTKAWLCINDPTSGQAHGLIFDKHTGFVEGKNDGIQIKISAQQHVKLPGLEADSGDLFAIRNAYEDGEHNTKLTKGTNVSFNVAYIAVQTGGYQAVNTEADIYQTLIKYRPIKRGNLSTEPSDDDTDRYILTAVVHFESSFPLGSLLSALRGKNFSYLSAELFKDDTFTSSGSIGRLQLGDVNIEFDDNATFFQKIKTVAGIFDIRNSTLFKTIRFSNLEEGTYLVKIYKENALQGNNRRYVGFSIVEVRGDTKTHIYCKPETTIQVSVIDQKQQPVLNANVMIHYQDIIIAEQTTDDNGSLSLPLPLYTNKAFSLRTVYDGFIISDSEIDLGFMNRWKTWIHTLQMDLYSLKLSITDTLGLPPAIDTNPTVASDEMVNSQTISASSTGLGSYSFSLLYPASYQLRLSYKSFEYLETISLSNDKTIDIVFPAEFSINLNVYNNVGSLIDTAKVSLDRDGKGPTEKVANGYSKLFVPPGTYNLDVSSDKTIAKQSIDVKGERTIDIVSAQDSSFHTIAPILFLIIGLGLCIFLFWKNQRKNGIYLLAVFLIAIALIQPWWQLTGDNGSVSTTTHTILNPANIITLTTSSQAIGGEISAVPEEFTMVLHIVTYLLLLSMAIILLNILIQKRFQRIATIIVILDLMLLLLSIILFYVAMSEVTKVGVGGFFGSSDLPITLPGESEQIILSCAWGGGLGLYSTLLALLLIISMPLTKIVGKIKNKFM